MWPEDIVVLRRNWLSSNNVLCMGDAPAVVDTGHLKHAAQTVALVQAQLPEEQPLAVIAHTHLHSDHCGGTAALQLAWPQATTLVPQPSLRAVQEWDANALSFADTAQRCERFVAHGPMPAADSATATLALGKRTWRVLPADGHDADAVLLFDEASGVLLAGDALWEHTVPVLFPEVLGHPGFTPFLRTLKLIERLQPAYVVPGHGDVFAAADGAVQAALGRARQRIAQFQDQPALHALYAAKVLVKYQLMDAGRMALAQWQQWMDEAPMLRALHGLHRPDMAWETWKAQCVVQPLLDKGAARVENGFVLDA